MIIFFEKKKDDTKIYYLFFPCFFKIFPNFLTHFAKIFHKDFQGGGKNENVFIPPRGKKKLTLSHTFYFFVF